MGQGPERAAMSRRPFNGADTLMAAHAALHRIHANPASSRMRLMGNHARKGADRQAVFITHIY